MTGELHIGFSQNEQIGFMTQTWPLVEVQENGKYTRESQYSLKGIPLIFFVHISASLHYMFSFFEWQWTNFSNSEYSILFSATEQCPNTSSTNRPLLILHRPKSMQKDNASTVKSLQEALTW